MEIGELVIKVVKVTWDGRSLRIRIPKAIEKAMDIKKGDELLWVYNKRMGIVMLIKANNKAYEKLLGL